MEYRNDLPALPKDKVVIKGGRVVEWEQWMLWNGIPCLTTQFRRQEDGTYLCNINDPEHGGRQGSGSLNDVLGMFHPEIIEKDRRLLEPEGVDEAFVRSLGRSQFAKTRCQVIVL